MTLVDIKEIKESYLRWLDHVQMRGFFFFAKNVQRRVINELTRKSDLI